MEGLIYKATNIVNNKIYIGQTSCSLEKRKNEHYNSLDNLYFHNAIRKYGKENFIWEILENNICSYEKLNQQEKYWIQYFHSNDTNLGYNLTKGGESIEPLNNWRKNNPDLAKKHAKECYAKMKEYMLNHPEKEEKRKQKAKENFLNYYNNHKEEWREQSYQTYLKHKAQQDEQMKKFHQQQSKKVQCLETGIIYPSASEASRQTKISQGNISACCRGERLSAGKTSDNKKLHWIYLNEEG